VSLSTLVAAETLLLMVFSATESNATLTNTILGFASANVVIN
jgi:hypothetical protein